MEIDEIYKRMKEYDASINIIHEELKSSKVSLTHLNESYDRIIGFKTAVFVLNNLIYGDIDAADKSFNSLYNRLLKESFK